jgi:hypothetical protein
MKWVWPIVEGARPLAAGRGRRVVGDGQKRCGNEIHAEIEVNAPPTRSGTVSEPEKLKQWVIWLVDIKTPDLSQRGETTHSEFVPPNLLRTKLAAVGMFEGEQSYRLTDLGSRRSRVGHVARARK